MIWRMEVHYAIRWSEIPDRDAVIISDVLMNKRIDECYFFSNYDKPLIEYYFLRKGKKLKTAMVFKNKGEKLKDAQAKLVETDSLLL